MALHPPQKHEVLCLGGPLVIKKANAQWDNCTRSNMGVFSNYCTEKQGVFEAYTRSVHHHVIITAGRACAVVLFKENGCTWHLAQY